MSNKLTVEQFQRVMPAQMKKKVDKRLVDSINKTLTDPILAESIRDNLLGYVSVLQSGKYRIKDYVNAVRYCSYTLMGDSNVVAYTKTFPDRYQHFVDNNTSEKDISSYVSIYNKGKLPQAIMEQSLTPSYILNQDLYQKALNVQAELMVTAKSEKVRADAANSILTHLKQPEKRTIELDIGVKDGGALKDLREATRNLVEHQRASIERGDSTAQQIAHSRIIEGEVL